MRRWALVQTQADREFGWAPVVLGNFNLSEIIRFAKALKGPANPMLSVLCLFLSTMFSVFRSCAALQVENLALRHQIGVLRRSAKKNGRR